MDTDGITAERLASWRDRLKEENATPMVLIGVGHDHKSGQIVLCVPEGVDDDLLIGSLAYALNALQPGLIPKHHGERKSFTTKS
jgi:hypothetical protein